MICASFKFKFIEFALNRIFKYGIDECFNYSIKKLSISKCKTNAYHKFFELNFQIILLNKSLRFRIQIYNKTKHPKTNFSLLLKKYKIS